MQDKLQITVNVPVGYEIDAENSTFKCIKFKPIKAWRDNNREIKGFGIYSGHPEAVVSEDSGAFGEKPLFATEAQARSALAMAKITQIIANDERFGGPISFKEWKFTSDVDWKYIITTEFNNIVLERTTTKKTLLAFHKKEQAELFLRENSDLIKDYYMLSQDSIVFDWECLDVCAIQGISL